MVEELPQAQAQAQVSELSNGHNGEAGVSEDSLEPIAIIGLSLKFPQEATSPQTFWDMLVEGRSAMTEMPKDRFNLEAYYDPDSEKPGTVSEFTLHVTRSG